MATRFFTPGQPLLDGSFPLALDAPFTRAMAAAEGIGSNDLTRMRRAALIRKLVEGVYVPIQVPDSLELRVAALALVIPPGAVVTDRTAAWLHGAEYALAPGDHLSVPPVSAFHRVRGNRLRTELTASGQRMMPDRDVMEVKGLCVTSRVRTACDLGRLLHRDAAFAAMDAMLRLGLAKAELLAAVERFRGFRGVRQLRTLAPWTDHRAESPPESVLRLRWLDCPHLPMPDLQRPVPGPWPGVTYWLDLGVDMVRFAVEYDGEEHHGPEQAEHDRARREWIRDQGWTVRVVRRANIFGHDRDVESVLAQGFREARERLARP